MKKITLSLIAILAFLTCSAQKTPLPIDSITKKVTVSEVVDSENSKDVLYEKALEWFAMTFKTSNDVLQLKDKAAGKMIGSFTIYQSTGGPVTGNIILLVKDKKYKYTITDLFFAGNGSFKPWSFEDEPNPFKVGMMKKGISYIKDQSMNNVFDLVKSLKHSMVKPLTTDGF
jgi:hypothetical protein